MFLNLVMYLIMQLERPSVPVSLWEGIGLAISIYFQACCFLLSVTVISIIGLTAGFILKKKELKIGFILTTAASIIMDLLVMKFS